MKSVRSFRQLGITVALCSVLLLLGAGAALASSNTSDTSSSTTAATTAAAQNKAATEEAKGTVDNEVTRSSASATVVTIAGRIANIQAPRPMGLTGGAGGGGGLVPGGGGTGGGQGPTSELETTSGVNAGDIGDRFGVWGMGQVSWLASTDPNSRFDGNIYTTMIGADYKPLEGLVVGLAGGYEHGYLITKYNSGSINNDGFSVIPYASYKITDSTTLDVLGGWTFLDYRNIRADISGSQDAVRAMVNTSLNQYFQLDAWTLSGQLGHMYVSERKDSYTESDGSQVGSSTNYLGEWRVEGKAAYYWNRLQPYLGAAYLYDYTMSNAVGADRDEIEGILGLNYFCTDQLTFTLEGANSFDRNHSQNTRALLNLRYSF